MRLFFGGAEIPKLKLLQAVVSWLWVGFVYALALLVTPLVSVVIVLTARKQDSHPLGEPTSVCHSQKYVVDGSSGVWEYWNSPYFKWWNNYEDGLLGEPSGRWS